MNASRFNYDRKPGTASLSRGRELPKWIRVTHTSRPVLNDSKGSWQKRIFAIVSRPIPSEGEGKIIRRILIFDNHLDSLRLVSEFGADLDTEEAASRWEMRTSIICGSILIATVIGAMLWPLFW
jgi:hypothetical protein